MVEHGMVDILVHNETQFIHCNSPSHCAKILGDKVLNGKASASPTTENILHPAVHTTELIINFINDSFIHLLTSPKGLIHSFIHIS